MSPNHPALIAALLVIFCAAPGRATRSSVWDVRSGRRLSDKVLLDRLAQADVVFLGELHDSAETHALELHLLQGLHGRRGAHLTLAMEMFERDVQPVVNDYLNGKTDEVAFLKRSRPWPNYATDYRPLIEYAKTRHLSIVASNAPQALVSRVGREGLSALRASPVGQVAPLV